MKNVTERFLEYVKYDTTSKYESETTPSTPGQLVFGKQLAAELKGIGMQDISVSKYGYVFATLPSNTDKEIPTIGFISHLDTSPDISGTNVDPQIIDNYKGGDIILNKQNNIILSPKEFPELNSYIGQSLITTDGTTLLGSDDKAGIAEIITAMEYLISHPEIKHGTIKIGFTPDEEIGRGADFFDVEKFNADFAYTIDGGSIGELEYESFNAADVIVKINGKNTHPGSAKGKMINSMYIAYEFINSFPKDERPENTEGYEGFFHLNNMKGTVESTSFKFLIRDFDINNFEKRKEKLMQVGNELNLKYGEGTIEINLKDMYFNMMEVIKKNNHIFNTAKDAMLQLGITPITHPIRGGTDGSRLSFMGLPAPNLFTGAENFHSKYEFVSINSLERSVEVILRIIGLYANGQVNNN